MNECTVCGFPTLRAEGHAEWCERVSAALRADLERHSVCTVDGCERTHQARGWCPKHYEYARSHGWQVAA